MKKIKDLIYKIKESTRLQLIVGAISVGLIATGVVGVIAYKNSNNSLASSGEVEEVNESEADIILTENESGEPFIMNTPELDWPAGGTWSPPRSPADGGRSRRA